jgi:hypothetical protein
MKTLAAFVFFYVLGAASLALAISLFLWPDIVLRTLGGDAMVRAAVTASVAVGALSSLWLGLTKHRDLLMVVFLVGTILLTATAFALGFGTLNGIIDPLAVVALVGVSGALAILGGFRYHGIYVG